MRFMPSAPMINDHMLDLQKHFGDIVAAGAAGTRIRRDAKHVLICFTNRCGSNFVASALSSNGFLNIAGEFFNADTIIEHCVENKLNSIADFVNWLINREGMNGYLVSKIAIGNLEVLAQAGIIDQLLDNSSFVMIERSDKLGQAISYDIARQTGKWRSDMVGEKKNSDLEFSYDRLIDIINTISDQNREFARFFGLNGIVPTFINYEQFEENPGYFIDYLSRFLGIPEISFVPTQVGIQRQAGRINRVWRDRYNLEGLSVT
jgi:LPS sulfotransferase NodH